MRLGTLFGNSGETGNASLTCTRQTIAVASRAKYRTALDSFIVHFTFRVTSTNYSPVSVRWDSFIHGKRKDSIFGVAVLAWLLRWMLACVLAPVFFPRSTLLIATIHASVNYKHYPAYLACPISVRIFPNGHDDARHADFLPYRHTRRPPAEGPRVLCACWKRKIGNDKATRWRLLCMCDIGTGVHYREPITGWNRRHFFMLSGQQ